jgi:hypothetical protein
MKTSRFVLWVCVYAFISVPAYGTPLGLLTDTNGTIQSGDKIFENFFASNLSVGSDPADFRDIDVIPVTVAGNHGLRFVGPFFAETTQVGSTIFIELGTGNMRFDVRTTDPNVQLQGMNQSWPFTHFGQGFLNFAVNTTAQSCPDVFCSGPGEFDAVVINTSLHGNGGSGPVIPSPGIISEQAIFPNGTDFLRVENIISIVAGRITDPVETLHPTLVSVPFVEFTFSQTTAVPEPATGLLLVPAGLAMLIAWRRGRTKAG